MRTYPQLTLAQRYHIYGLLKAGSNRTQIAPGIGVHKAQQPRIAVSTWDLVTQHSRHEWSPEQISGCSGSVMACTLATSASTNMGMPSNARAASSSAICAAKSNVANAMGTTTDAASYPTAAALASARRWWRNACT